MQLVLVCDVLKTDFKTLFLRALCVIKQAFYPFKQSFHVINAAIGGCNLCVGGRKYDVSGNYAIRHMKIRKWSLIYW